MDEKKDALERQEQELDDNREKQRDGGNDRAMVEEGQRRYER